MGANFDDGSMGKKLTTAGLGAASGALQAAGGQQPQPVDFGAIVAKFKKKQPDTVTLTDNPNKILPMNPSPAPDFSFNPPGPMPDLYGQQPRVRSPFFGSY